MRIRSILLITLILVGNAAASDWATTTTTHIESSPWGTYKKIEFPKAELPRSGSSVDYKCLYMMDARSLIYGNYQFSRIGILHVPFACMVTLNNHTVRDFERDIVYGPEHTSPRLKHDPIANNIVFGDQPLFCLFEYDSLLLRVEGQVSDVTQNEQNTLAERVMVLDTPPVSLFEGEFWGKDCDEFYAYRWLNTPISTVYSEIKTPEEESMCVLKALFVSAYDHNKNSKGGIHDSILDLGLVQGYKHTVDVTLNGETVVSKHEYYGVGDLILGSGVWISESSEKGSTRRFLSLPFVGPVWASWRNTEKDSETHWGVFPILWLWATDIPRPPSFEASH